MNVQGQIVELGELPDQNGNGFEIISAGAKIFLTYPMTDFGREMFTSDGTPLGTGLVLNIWPGAGSANVTEMAVCGPDLFFSANNITNGQEPWKLANVVLFDGGGSDERDSNASMEEQPSVLPLRIAPEINVYPNPATDFIRIDLIDNESFSGNLSLMDASGRSLRKAQAQAGETIIQLEISDLPKGVYIVRWVQSDGQAVTKKVVVQ
jgi:ELWxxDGT repeat protein